MIYEWTSCLSRNPEKFCSLRMLVEVQDGCSRMDWLSLDVLVVGSADVVFEKMVSAFRFSSGQVHGYKCLLRLFQFVPFFFFFFKRAKDVPVAPM